MNPRPLKYTLAVAAVSAAASLLSVGVLAKDDTMSKTGTQYKADPDMQSVLDALAAMNPKPIETLEPPQARKQPTPTDAVMAVLKQKGKPTDPTLSSPASPARTRLSRGRPAPCPCASTRRKARARSRSSCTTTAAAG